MARLANTTRTLVLFIFFVHVFSTLLYLILNPMDGQADTPVFDPVMTSTVG